MNQKHVVCGIIIAIVFCSIASYGNRAYKKHTANYSGIPDAVSSYRTNKSERLAVTANVKSIDDKEVFAKNIIQMCKDNAFHTIKFDEMPSQIEIIAYLQRDDIGEIDPVCRIEYKTDTYTEKLNIRDDADEYRLYVDGNEIQY